MSDHTPGAGPGINKTIPRKRIKAAHRKYLAAGGTLPLRRWATEGPLNGMALKWLANKKLQRK
jgi:hypothetical protein